MYEKMHELIIKPLVYVNDVAVNISLYDHVKLGNLKKKI